MARLQGALFSAALAVLIAVPAAAQIGGHPYEISGSAGLFSPDIRARMQTSPAYNSSIGWRFGPTLSIDLQGTWAPSHADSGAASDEHNHNFFLGGADLRIGLRFLDQAAYGAIESRNLVKVLHDQLGEA